MEIENCLAKNNIKKTSARILILKILSHSDNAMNVESIYNECRSKEANIDISTVYRTLELFSKKNIVKKFDFGDGKYNYSIKKKFHKHILECKFCGKEVEIDCPMQQVEETIKNTTGFTISEDEFDEKIIGICESCRNKRKEL